MWIRPPSLIVLSGVWCCLIRAGSSDELESVSDEAVKNTRDPWLVSIQKWEIEQSSWEHICTGVLIMRSVILSSGLCVSEMSPNQSRVALNKYNLGIPEPGELYMAIHSIYYSAKMLEEEPLSRIDISLVKTIDQISLIANPGVRPIEWKGSSLLRDVLGIECRVSSWGPMDFYMHQNAHIPRQRHLKLINATLCLSIANLPQLNPLNFCGFASRTAEPSFAMGDFGAPIVCPYRGNETVVGVMSADTALLPGVPVFTDIFLARDWVIHALVITEAYEDPVGIEV